MTEPCDTSQTGTGSWKRWSNPLYYMHQHRDHLNDDAPDPSEREYRAECLEKYFDPVRGTESQGT